jgi:hypothetical protein
MSAPVALADALEAFRVVHPRFGRVWLDAAAESQPEEPSTLALLSESAFATVELIRDADRGLERIFELVERLLAEGDIEVVDYVQTDFIEVLSNIWPQDLDPVLWKRWLGPRSEAIAREWAQFWGAPD